MCGIVGIFAYRSAEQVDRGELCAIRDHMASRGPDGAGEWFNSDRRVALGHRRLSIIDLTERGAQPMLSADGRYAISFNGEIYNYRELRAAMERQGRRFESGSDTEVLLQLYVEKGEAMLHDLRGMFAFAIWDGPKGQLFLARDAFGIKPLYYADQGGTFRFASQVRALLRSPAIDTTPSPAGHAGFFLWGSVPEPWTLYQGIKALPAGHQLVVTNTGAGVPVSWCRITDVFREAEGAPASGDRQAALTAIVGAVHDSVRAHMVADVPVGVFLSAGLDSSLIALSATALGSSPPTVTLGFDEFRGTAEDEAPLAEELARQLGSWHSTVMTRRQDFEDERDALFAAMDQPSIDGVNTWFVARAARRMGLKVALSGLGGDELFGSYPSFHQLPMLVRRGQHMARLPFLGTAFRLLSAPVLSRLTSPKYAGVLEYSRSLGSAFLLRRCLHMPWELPTLMGQEMATQGQEELQTLVLLDAATRGIKQERLAISGMEMSWYMRNQLLRDADWAGMAQSLEIRVPLLDITLLRSVAPWFAAHPSITKAELASAAGPLLPRRLLSRPKSGFSVPVKQWMGGAVTPNSERGLRGWAHRVYRQFVPSRPKRVLLLATDAYGGHGGIALYNRDLANAIAIMPDVDELVVIPRTLPLPPEGIPPKVKFLKAGAAGKVAYASTALAAAAGPFNLVICGHINLLPLAATLNLKLRAPLALVVYGIDVWSAPSRVTRRLLSRVDTVWSISEVTRDRMISWSGLSAERFVKLPNAVHLDRYGMAERRKDLQEQYGLVGRKVVMTLARLLSLERYKGVDEVLEVLPSVIAQEPALTYLVVGDGNDRARLEAKAASLGLAGHVVFAGLIDESIKADILRLADAFVMPGRGEGFGFVFLEAMACGVPTVGSQVDGSREALMNGELGELVNPADPAAIKQGIFNALRKPKSVPPALSHFDWPRFASRVSSAVRTLVQASP